MSVVVFNNVCNIKYNIVFWIVTIVYEYKRKNFAIKIFLDLDISEIFYKWINYFNVNFHIS